MTDRLTVDDELFLLQHGYTLAEVAALALMHEVEVEALGKDEVLREMIALLKRTGALTLRELLDAGTAEAVAFARHLLACRLLAWRRVEADRLSDWPA